MASMNNDVDKKKRNAGNYGVLSRDECREFATTARLLQAPANFFILFDSRAIHSNHCRLVKNSLDLRRSLIRMNIYVCYTPARTNPETLEFRRRALEENWQTNHWPWHVPTSSTTTTSTTNSKAVKKRSGPVKRESLLYPRHRAFLPLQSAAMSPEDVRRQFPGFDHLYYTHPHHAKVILICTQNV